MDKPYNLNQASDAIARDVLQRIRRRLEGAGIFLDLGNLPEVETLIEQYGAEATEMYDRHGRAEIAYQKRIEILMSLLRVGVSLVQNPGTDEERQRWMARVHVAMMDVLLEEITAKGGQSDG
ncbi:MAG: hypothetical protein E6Q97_07200 [Desulfurellales bacterium]|nr:MAG: hypothetical protein E6Q97_07200 [Desulfurellales bacterium]